MERRERPGIVSAQSTMITVGEGNIELVSFARVETDRDRGYQLPSKQQQYQEEQG